MYSKSSNPTFHCSTGQCFPIFSIYWHRRKAAVFVHYTGEKRYFFFFLVSKVLCLATPRAERIHVLVIPVTRSPASAQKLLGEPGRAWEGRGWRGFVCGLGVSRVWGMTASQRCAREGPQRQKLGGSAR